MCLIKQIRCFKCNVCAKCVLLYVCEYVFSENASKMSRKTEFQNNILFKKFKPQIYEESSKNAWKKCIVTKLLTDFNFFLHLNELVL